MAYPDNKSGTGTQIIFGTSMWTAIVDDLDPDFDKRATIDVSGITDTRKQKIPADQIDSGKVSVKFHYNPGTPPPSATSNETITIVYPATAGGATSATATTRESVAYSGFVTDYKVGIKKGGDIMHGTVEIEFSGAPTYVHAS